MHTRAMLFKSYGGEVFLSRISGSKRVRMSKSQIKTMLITIFDIKGIFHFEFIPQARTFSRAYYSLVEILRRLHEAVRRKRPELWPNDWILHHDNVPAHKALSVKQFLAQKFHY
jgi:hypothetical protein